MYIGMHKKRTGDFSVPILIFFSTHEPNAGKHIYEAIAGQFPQGLVFPLPHELVRALVTYHLGELVMDFVVGIVIEFENASGSKFVGSVEVHFLISFMFCLIYWGL